MSNNPYEAPKAKIAEVSEKTPLSRASGKNKLLVGITTSVICGVLAYFEILPGITRMLSIIMGAYALVGLIEVVGGESLVSLAKRWDSLPGWKKFILSVIVIIIAFTIFMVLAINIAKFI